MSERIGGQHLDGMYHSRQSWGAVELLTSHFDADDSHEV